MTIHPWLLQLAVQLAAYLAALLAVQLAAQLAFVPSEPGDGWTEGLWETRLVAAKLRWAESTAMSTEEAMGP